MNKLTFIIPSINRPSLINTLISLQNQTDVNWNAIVIFDGMDCKPSIFDNRIHYINIPKKGFKNCAGLVRNEGIKLVKTNWIAFVDDDDTLESNYVSSFNRELDLNPEIDVCIFRMIYSNGLILPQFGICDFPVNNVGISFFVKTSCFNSDNIWFIPSETEDFDILDKYRKNNKNIHISNSIVYNVNPMADNSTKIKIENIPIFIISYNNYTHVKNMVEQLQKYTTNISIIDNCSSYPPLVSYLKFIESRVRVIYKDQNYGHRVVYRPEIQELMGEKYIITDPDLQLNPNLPSNFIEILDELTEKYQICRIGLALDIFSDDINPNVMNKFVYFEGGGSTNIRNVEQAYWNKKIPDDTYELYVARTDTTFSFINKKYNYVEYNGFRIAGNFTCKHKPFHIKWKNELLSGELEFYANNNTSTTSFNIVKNQYTPSFLRKKIINQ